MQKRKGYHAASSIIRRVDPRLFNRLVNHHSNYKDCCVGEVLNVLIRLNLWKVKEFNKMKSTSFSGVLRFQPLSFTQILSDMIEATKSVK